MGVGWGDWSGLQSGIGLTQRDRQQATTYSQRYPPRHGENIETQHRKKDPSKVADLNPEHLSWEVAVLKHHATILIRVEQYAVKLLSAATLFSKGCHSRRICIFDLVKISDAPLDRNPFSLRDFCLLSQS